jgi:hypothetical protein
MAFVFLRTFLNLQMYDARMCLSIKKKLCYMLVNTVHQLHAWSSHGIAPCHVTSHSATIII